MMDDKNTRVDGLYRVEIVEITEKYGEIARIDCPCNTMEDILKEVENFKNIYDDELKSGKWFIKVEYVKIRYN